MSWQNANVDDTGGVSIGLALAFTSAGQPAISYHDRGNENLKYAVFDGSAWQITTVDAADDVGRYSSLAFTASGQPAVSYYDETNKDLKYASRAPFVLP